ncbi:hypothetical protein LCGC14_1167510 [marine sediment metagenome]|uniref:Uncharacterized protein n=1 Tax=marine sediment metagenome TaxID=412755 RepID=A0A0F9P8X8_9ZZZZ
MKFKTYLKAGWWLGILTTISITGFIQDWYGLEKYKRVITDNWIHMSPWWWLIPWLVSFFLSLYYYSEATKGDKNDA